MVKQVYIALGSNLDSPSENLQRAAGRLAAIATGNLKTSSIWVTKPEGFSEEVPDFCNAVIAMSVRLSPQALLGELQAIEAAFGREHRPDIANAASRQSATGYASRRLDLDIIDYDGQLIDEPDLTLPHPRAFKRQFVLAPLNEVNPTFRFPGIEASIESLMASAPINKMERVTRLIPLA